MKSNKKIRIIAIVTVAVIAVCAVCFTGINLIMHLKPSEKAVSVSAEAECINENGYSVDKILFKTETEDEVHLFFTTKRKECFSAVLTKNYYDDHHFEYEFKSAQTDTPRTIIKTEDLGNLRYAGVVFKRDIKNFDFEGYTPQRIELTYPVSLGPIRKGEETVHFYYFDTTAEPRSDINYAPVYGLFDDEDINAVLDITDAAFSFADNSDINSFAESIGAKGVLKLPASTDETYDYTVSDNFSVRSFGKPVETVKISTEFGYIMLDLDSKTIEAGY